MVATTAGHFACPLRNQLLTLGIAILAVAPELAFAAETRGIPTGVYRQLHRPVLIRNEHNSLLQIEIECSVPFLELRSIKVEVEGVEQLESLQLFLAQPDEAFPTDKPFGERVTAASTIELAGHARLVKGKNRLWLSCRVRANAELTKRVDAKVIAIETSAGEVVPTDATPDVRKRIGVALRRHWDDGVHTYRIPALATATDGTLLAVYDMRRRARRDLQEDIDIGLLRSQDGGQSWSRQQVIMDMGTFGNLPQEQNGCSDPGVLVDPATGEVFCFAVWTHGRPGTHQWRPGGSAPGLAIDTTAQFMMVRSSDNGRTWTAPENLTRKIKQPSWILYAPSPQQGIALVDGTLVMPTQGRNENDRRFSNLLVSRDHGKSWTPSNPASLDNTECQAAQLSDGSIMLNSRSTQPTKYRSVAVTKDVGQTWTRHSTHRKALIEPNCNGSLYRFVYKHNAQRQTVLLFANPHSQQGRTHHSVQVSFDDGVTWPATHRLLLDEGRGNGYPSLSRVDDEHVGIVYEGSGAHLVFEKLHIDELTVR